MSPYYQDDSSIIYNEDNCDVLCWLEKESIDLIVTSPPYDNLRNYGGHSWDFYGVAWLLTRVLKPGGVIVWIVNDATEEGSETGSSFRQAIHFQNLGLNIHDTMIWNKTGFTATGSLAVRYAPVFEYMLVFSKGKPKTFKPIKDHKNKTVGMITGTIRQPDGTFKPVSNAGKLRTEVGQRFNIWDIPNPGIPGNLHPAVFPKQIASDHIVSWSNKGDAILDPFMGSGTTLRAAKELGRFGIGIEIHEPYCKIAKDRLNLNVIDFGQDIDYSCDEIEPPALSLDE